MESQLGIVKEHGHRAGEPARVRDLAASPLHPLLQLQQQAGNQAVQELLRSRFIQAKLAISSPDDPEEREADNVAQTIMRSHAGAPVSPCSCAEGEEMCQECQQKATLVQRIASAPAAPAHVPRIVGDVLCSAGRPLDAATRAFFEPRFGRDFSAVRVHTGPEAAASAQAINAHAYTAGSDIVFAVDQYSPDTTAGRTLLAHELSHVLRRSESPAPAIRRQSKGGAGEPFLAQSPRLEIPFLLTPRAGGISGPLPAGTLREDKGLVVRQITEQHVIIEYADARIEITADPGGVYSYFVDEAEEREARPQPLLQFPIPEETPKRPVQRVVRFAANSSYKFHVERPQVPEDGRPLLVLQESYVGTLHTAPGLTGEIEEWWISANSVQLRVDSSIVQITAPADNPSLRSDDYPGARFAYSFEPEWTGPLGLEKHVFIVASPGVKFVEGTANYARGTEYGRKLIPVFIRVPHPDLVPRQGTSIDPSAFVGVQDVGDATASFGVLPQGLTDQQKHRLLTVSQGFSGVTVTHPWSGSRVSLRSTDPSIGAAFAWQVLPPTDESFGEIRVVVGPNTFLEFAEPVPSRLRGSGGPVAPPLAGTYQQGEGLEEERVTLRIVEVFQNADVPVPGTPINIDYYLGRGKPRDPDAHEWIGVDETASKIADFVIRLIPIVGELYSIGEFVHAVRYGENFLGEKVKSADFVLMGAGIVIGLIPYVGAGIGAVSRVAKAAAALGKTAEELEATIVTLSRVASEEEQAVLSRGARLIEQGAEIPEEELPKLQAALSRVAPGVALSGEFVIADAGAFSLAPEAFETLDNPQFAQSIVKEFRETGKVPAQLTDALERSGVSSIEEQRAVAQQFLRDAARNPASGIDAQSVEGIVKQLPETFLEDVSGQTKTFLKSRPELRGALERSRLATRALKKCKSLCFPEHLTSEEVERLEKVLEAVGKDKHVNFGELSEYLHGLSKREFEAQLRTWEERFLEEGSIKGIPEPIEFGEPGLAYGKGSPPTAASAKGLAGAAEHALEVTERVPMPLSPARASALRRTLLSGDESTLARIVRELPEEGVAELMFPTAEGQRIVDHVFFDGQTCRVVFRESKNVEVFKLTPKVAKQLSKDLSFLKSPRYAAVRIEWRISGSIDQEALDTLRGLQREWSGRFTFQLDSPPGSFVSRGRSGYRFVPSEAPEVITK